MHILGLDPGETLGVCRIYMRDGVPILDAYAQLRMRTEDKELDLTAFSEFVQQVLESTNDAVVVEDFRLYSSSAMAQVNSRMFTSELIGAIKYATYQAGTNLEVVHPSKKGRWPEARLNAKVHWHARVTRPHAHDALVLALIYAEQHGHLYGREQTYSFEEVLDVD